jgi:hypothetical protein
MVKKKKEKLGYPFIAMPRHILDSQEYAQLRPPAVKLLLDLFAQFRGKNNGDFCAAWKIMRKRGWRSRDTLSRALKELLEAGFIQKTRQGGKNRCSLYAVTWLSINECDDKLDVTATRTPANSWKLN